MPKKGGHSTMSVNPDAEGLILSVLLQAISEHFSPLPDVKRAADDFIKSDGFNAYVDAIAPSADPDVLREVILSGKLTKEDFEKNLKVTAQKEAKIKRKDKTKGK